MARRAIRARADLDRGLAHIVAIEPIFAETAALVGPLPLRLRPPGFEPLLQIIVEQQLSLASADAIWGRLLDETQAQPARVAAMDEACARRAGLSRAKARYCVALAEAVETGALDLAALEEASDEDAMTALMEIKGIGRWTAEIYLLFCLGRADLFPSGDLALRQAAADALGLEARPSIKEMDALAESWSPWRGVAARLLWAYYRLRHKRGG